MTSSSPVEQAGCSHPQLHAVVAVLTASPAPIVAADERDRIVFANRHASSLFGYAVDDLLGQPVSMLAARADAETVEVWRSAFDDGPRAGAGHGHAATGRRRDGTEVPVELSLTPLDLGAGCRWIIAGVLDVSAKVEAQQKVVDLRRAYLLLAQLNQAVIVAQDAEELFASTTRICVEQGGFLAASIAVPVPDGNVRIMARAGVLDDFLSSLDISLDPDDPRGRGPTARVLREGRPRFFSDFASNHIPAHWREAAIRYGVGAAIALPLSADGRVAASLTVYADRPSAFDRGIEELFVQLADNVSHALDGFAAAQALAAEARARRDLMERLVAAEETERARIAAGIHDDSVQTLAAAGLRLELMLRRLSEHPELGDVSAMARTICATVVCATASLRDLLFELEPPLLALGFGDALDTTAEHVLAEETTTWSVGGADGVVLPDVERAQALRIVKEALINIRKHASATHVDIRVRRVPDGVELAVTDDGVGLPTHTDPDRLVGRRGHRGLETMRDRAAATGGWCRLERAPTGGVSLRFFIPVSPRS